MMRTVTRVRDEMNTLSWYDLMVIYYRDSLLLERIDSIDQGPMFVESRPITKCSASFKHLAGIINTAVYTHACSTHAMQYVSLCWSSQ